MNLKFISRTFDLHSKADHSETFEIKSKTQVIIKVYSAFIFQSSFNQGIGEVVAAGRDFVNLIGKIVEFSLMTASWVLKEYEICEGNFCFVTKSSILVNEALTSMMLAEFIKKHQPKYVAHVSNSTQVCKFLSRLIKSSGIDLVTVTKPINSGVLDMLKYDMLLVGHLGEEFVLNEKTPNKSVVFQYSWNCSSRILHSGTFVKQTVFDWYSKLGYLSRKQFLYFAQFNSGIFENDIPEKTIQEFFEGNEDQMVCLNVPQVFLFDLSSFRRESIYTARVTKSNIPSFSGSLYSIHIFAETGKEQLKLDEVINPNSIASPRCPQFELSQNSDEFLEGICESIRTDDSYCTDLSIFQDSTLIEYLSQLILKYSDPEVLKTLSSLSTFFNIDVQSSIKVFIKFLEEDSSVFEGQMNDLRCPHGFGSRYFKDGSVFRGYWKNGKADGKGILASSDKMLYVGIWKKGLFHGYGSLFLKDRTYREGYFRKGKLNGFGIEILPNGEKYHGGFLNDHRHDGGEIVNEDGECFLVGHFKGVPLEQRKSKTFEGFQVVDFLDKTWKLSGINLIPSDNELDCVPESFSVSSLYDSFEDDCCK